MCATQSMHDVEVTDPADDRNIVALPRDTCAEVLKILQRGRDNEDAQVCT